MLRTNPKEPDDRRHKLAQRSDSLSLHPQTPRIIDPKIVLQPHRRRRSPPTSEGLGEEERRGEERGGRKQRDEDMEMMNARDPLIWDFDGG